MRKLFVTLSALALCVGAGAQNRVSVSYISLDEEKITSTPVKEYEQGTEKGGSKATVRLYPEIEFQEIAGMGGCFNEIGGEALASLSRKAQREVIDALFGEDKSAFEFCRASIGASDFGRDAYSFSEVDGDYTMEHFSMKREKQYMLPYIQMAIKKSPDLKLFASPWSPPGWMKYSGYMDRGNEFPEKNRLIDDPKIYEAYALYFLKYVEAYRKEGVDVDRILIQNEQDFHTKYPSCRMPVEQMTKFVSEYMRPLFEKNGIDTEIWAGTFRTAGEQEGLRLAANEEWRKEFDGVGIQYTKAQHAAELQFLSPGIAMMHTEGACHNGLNSWAQARGRFTEISNYINSGCQNFGYWNMILNESGESGWGWRQNALITIDRQEKSVTYNPDYSVMALVSQAMRAGSVRIASYSTVPVITISTEEGYVIILQNDKEEPMSVNCILNGATTQVTIPAKSLSSIFVEAA